MPVIIRQIKVALSGSMWNASLPQFTDFRFVDVVSGKDLFGIQQLVLTGSVAETLSFSGAYTLPPNTIGIIELQAKTSAGFRKNSTLSTTIDRNGILFANGGNGNPLTDFYPRTLFPAFTLK